MALDPVKTSQKITENYLAYLSTMFSLKDDELQQQFVKTLGDENFTRGPIIEATPPFEKGASIEELIREGTLSQEFKKLNSKKLPLDRPLYYHQEQAIRKAVALKRNVVVATGTGSGKTETFLVPILNHLLKEKEQGTLVPGVRALLLYPMNALVNDQLGRLRELLNNYPHITFGRYTGETRYNQSQAEEEYQRTYHQPSLPNELLSREEMRENPPHMLITNYAMLEYLLLRPGDTVFFDGDYSNEWNFIVLDEVHTYNGAKGIEMSMLLRRLKDRVLKKQDRGIQCIATSATLGRGREDFQEVALFGTRLFGEPFEWVENDDRRQDVIEAQRAALGSTTDQWGMPQPQLYEKWLEVIEGESQQNIVMQLLELGKNYGVDQEILAQAANKTSGADYTACVFYVLKGDRRVVKLMKILEEKPTEFTQAATEIFGSVPNAERYLAKMVELAARAKVGDSDQTLIPARYHFFVKAVEGAYVSLLPQKKLFVNRMTERTDQDNKTAVFEAASCQQCGEIYLVGEIVHDGERNIFKQPGKKSYDDSKNLKFFVIKEKQSLTEDEDEAVAWDLPDTQYEHYKLCGRCGAIGKATQLSATCQCSDDYFDLLEVKSKEGVVYRCPSCGKQSPRGLVRRFLTGKDATGSVLATALYQQIPYKKSTSEHKVEFSESDDPWGSTDVAAAAENSAEEKTGRQLLVFSDSRQDAAFFAPYLETTYNRILHRRLIMLALEKNRDRAEEMKWRLQDLVRPLTTLAREKGLVENLSPEEQQRTVWNWLLYEFLAIDNRLGLEGMGLLGYSMVKPEAWRPPRPLLLSPWNLAEEEVWTLYQILLNTLRIKGAVTFPDGVDCQDEFFAPRNRAYHFRCNDSSPKQAVFSWVPTGGSMNSRLDFLSRLAEKLSLEITKEMCGDLLKNFWRSFELDRQYSCWGSYFNHEIIKKQGVVYTINTNVWELKSSIIDPSVKWYYCDKCSNLHLLNLKGLCPNYRCTGTLRQCQPKDILEDNHYRRLYTKLQPLRLHAREHTAQLKNTTAAELQQKFITGDVNVLSCSTTFELGVDVGELETVFMRNVPPSAANYVQRAGRAGRRQDSTAFALTFAQRSSHDMTHFREPERMVSGKISAPNFKVDNEKIVRRHVYATALSMFWKIYREAYGKGETKNFILSEELPATELFPRFLNEKPVELKNSLKRIVPDELHQILDLDNWGWIEGLFEPNEGVLIRAYQELANDIEELKNVMDKRRQENKPADHILRAINTMENRSVINYLSTRNVLPKYGFPVDVVELQLLNHFQEAKSLELSRDLKIGLSEYAPGSKVVAGGKLWTSRYLKLLTNRSWPRYRYAICDNCQSYERVQADSEGELENCAVCGAPFGKNKGEFVIPEFGFVVDRDKPANPGEKRPEKTYTTRTYYSGEAHDGKNLSISFGEIVVSATPAFGGKLAVLNTGNGRRFRICHSCGYAVLGGEKPKTPHHTPWGRQCYGSLHGGIALGHEFTTDILQLRFNGYIERNYSFWQSLLYAVLEGAAEALEIERQDIDGCLYPYAGDLGQQALILYDSVPGGAGHVPRMAKDEEVLRRVLKTTLKRMQSCDCGGHDGHSSCYGCLRNYGNQFCHDELDRGSVVEFLGGLL